MLIFVFVAISSIANFCSTASEKEQIPPIYLQNLTEYKVEFGNPTDCDPPFNDKDFVVSGIGYCKSLFVARAFCKLNCINECDTKTLTSVFSPELVKTVPDTYKCELINGLSLQWHR